MFYDINHENEYQFIEELKKELHREQTGFHQGLSGQQVQFKHISLDGLREVMEEISRKVKGTSDICQELEDILFEGYQTPTKWSSERKLRTQSWFSLDTNDTSSDSDQDEQTNNPFSQKIAKLLHSDYQFTPFETGKKTQSHSTDFSNPAEEGFFSDPDSPDQDEPLNNGGDFFSKFYFDKLVQDMET